MPPNENLLAELIYNPIDVCYTDLMHTYPWESRYKSVKWDNLVRTSHFDEFRVLARQIFDKMERNGAQCPTVTKVDGKLWMTWTETTRVFRIVFSSDEPLIYFRGHTSDLFELSPFVIDDKDDFLEMLPVIAHFISPPKVYDESRES